MDKIVKKYILLSTFASVVAIFFLLNKYDHLGTRFQNSVKTRGLHSIHQQIENSFSFHISNLNFIANQIEGFNITSPDFIINVRSIFSAYKKSFPLSEGENILISKRNFSPADISNVYISSSNNLFIFQKRLKNGRILVLEKDIQNIIGHISDQKGFFALINNAKPLLKSHKSKKLSVNKINQKNSKIIHFDNFIGPQKFELFYVPPFSYSSYEIFQDNSFLIIIATLAIIYFLSISFTFSKISNYTKLFQKEKESENFKYQKSIVDLMNIKTSFEDLSEKAKSFEEAIKEKHHSYSCNISLFNNKKNDEISKISSIQKSIKLFDKIIEQNKKSNNSFFSSLERKSENIIDLTEKIDHIRNDFKKVSESLKEESYHISTHSFDIALREVSDLKTKSNLEVFKRQLSQKTSQFEDHKNQIKDYLDQRISSLDDIYLKLLNDQKDFYNKIALHRNPNDFYNSILEKNQMVAKQLSDIVKNNKYLSLNLKKSEESITHFFNENIFSKTFVDFPDKDLNLRLILGSEVLFIKDFVKSELSDSWESFCKDRASLISPIHDYFYLSRDIEKVVLDICEKHNITKNNFFKRLENFEISTDLKAA